mmetsp:Transcript_81103/g.262705  ORF Transcript_81103/g.262705 Transcript_81103/m.262705 type:complete len:290 (-) Transcript_81103:3445-4314(-)
MDRRGQAAARTTSRKLRRTRYKSSLDGFSPWSRSYRSVFLPAACQLLHRRPRPAALSVQPWARWWPRTQITVSKLPLCLLSTLRLCSPKGRCRRCGLCRQCRARQFWHLDQRHTRVPRCLRHRQCEKPTAAQMKAHLGARRLILETGPCENQCLDGCRLCPASLSMASARACRVVQVWERRHPKNRHLAMVWQEHRPSRHPRSSSRGHPLPLQHCPFFRSMCPQGSGRFPAMEHFRIHSCRHPRRRILTRPRTPRMQMNQQQYLHCQLRTAQRCQPSALLLPLCSVRQC